jgi:hypothetical protein
MRTSVTDWYEAIQEYSNACANTTSARAPKSEGGVRAVMQLMSGCGGSDKPVGRAVVVSRWYA